MMRSKRGRPAIWQKAIVDYLSDHEAARARDIQLSLGIPRRSLYNALTSLVDSGFLVWGNRQGNYRTVQIKKNDPLEPLAFLAGLGL